MNKTILIITVLLLALLPGVAIADPMAELGTRAARAATMDYLDSTGVAGVL